MLTSDQLADIAPERVRPLKRVEFEKMVAEGLFDDERVELLDGWIVEMSPQSPHHAAVLQRLDRALQRALGDRAVVRVQMPFSAGTASLPEPDAALVPLGDYDDTHPTQAFLVVEVADSSLRKDQRVKAEMYAQAGVDEYWVVNLADQVIEVSTDRRETGYARTDIVRPGEVLRLRAFADVAIPVSDLLRQR
jgi:Uma2 family endonuclease